MHLKKNIIRNIIIVKNNYFVLLGKIKQRHKAFKMKIMLTSVLKILFNKLINKKRLIKITWKA